MVRYCQTATKGERWQSKKQEQKNYRINNLFRHSEQSYRIEKVPEYYNQKYKTNRSEWKIHGNVDIFQLQNVLKELVNRMTEHLQDNTKLQVSLENSKNDKVSQTKLFSQQEVVNKLADLVNFFIDY